MSGRGEEGAPAPRPKRSNLQLRIISAIVLGLAVLLITYLGGLPFRLMSAAMAGAIFYEWCAMRPGPGVHTAIAGALLAGVMLVMILGQPATILFLVLAAALLVLALHGWMSGSGLGTAAGLAYAAAPHWRSCICAPMTSRDCLRFCFCSLSYGPPMSWPTSPDALSAERNSRLPFPPERRGAALSAARFSPF